MNVIIAGSRTFNDYRKLREFCDEILEPYDDITIFSGVARGADELGENYALTKGYPVRKFPADWKNIEGKPEIEIGKGKRGYRYWKLAGFMRNKEMAKEADMLIVFWDGQSRGTKHMIEIAKKKKVEVELCIF